MSDIDVSNTYAIDKQNPVDAIMGSDGIISRYGGELVRDNLTIRLYQSRGLDRDVLISYGKNVIGINETIDISSVVTRLMPIGKDGLLLPEKYLDSSLISNYPHPIVKAIEFNNCETTADLRIAGQTYLSQNDKPLVNYKIDFIELTKTVEYANYSILETVYMGDTVTVRHSKLGIDLKFKVIRIRTNALTNRIEEVELGSFKPNLATSINNAIASLSNQQAQDKSDLQQAIDNATSQINSALGGYVVKRNGELLIMDTEDVSTATKVWRWNEGGLGYSGTGYNGPYRTAITADGHIVADFMDTGSLNASIIKTGTITSKTGKLSIGLDDEVLNIGGKIVYDGATGQVTFAPSVVLSWNNIGDKPAFAPSNADNTAGALLGNGFTKIGSNYVYTGTLTAEQINAIAINGITITAVDELAIRGHADTNLGVNPKLVWQCADSDGTSSIRNTPTNAGGGITESDTLVWEVNSNDADGTSEVYRGRIFVQGKNASGVGGWADLIVKGTLQVGIGGGYHDAPFGVDMTGKINFGGVCDINPYGGYLRLATAGGYIRINKDPATEGFIDFIYSDPMAGDTRVGTIGLNGVYTGSSTNVSGGDALTTTAVYSSDGLGLTVTRDGVVQDYVLTKDDSGRVDSLISGAIVTTIAYSVDGLSLTVTTNGSVQTYTLTRDSSNRVDSITTGSGSSTTITY